MNVPRTPRHLDPLTRVFIPREDRHGRFTTLDGAAYQRQPLTGAIRRCTTKNPREGGAPGRETRAPARARGRDPMKPRPAKAALRPADGPLLVIAATLRDRASFYRLCGDEHLAVALELEAFLAEELARVTPITDRPTHPES